MSEVVAPGPSGTDKAEPQSKEGHGIANRRPSQRNGEVVTRRGKNIIKCGREAEIHCQGSYTPPDSRDVAFSWAGLS
jgi:hypothetical protein